jgi:hypothetical protein
MAVLSAPDIYDICGNLIAIQPVLTWTAAYRSFCAAALIECLPSIRAATAYSRRLALTGPNATPIGYDPSHPRPPINPYPFCL